MRKEIVPELLAGACELSGTSKCDGGCGKTAPVARDSRYQDEYSTEFADTFDEIVGWASRSERERAGLTSLLRRHGARRVLDAACGTGFHLFLLAQEDLDLVGTDGAEAMIAKANENLAGRGMTVPLHVCDWRELAQCRLGLFDAILCLGDSFAHLLSAEQQRQALRQFFELLAPGGMLVLDHRNYDRVVARGSYVEQPSGYCCCGDTPPRELKVGADGLVTSRYRGGNGAEFAFQTFPVSQIDLAGKLKEVGFVGVHALHAGSYAAAPSAEDDFVVEVAMKARLRQREWHVP